MISFSILVTSIGFGASVYSLLSGKPELAAVLFGAATIGAAINNGTQIISEAIKASKSQ